MLESSEAAPEIHRLLAAHLEDYVRIFRWPDFHTLYQGGLLSIKGPNNIQFGFHFESLLRITGELTRLERFPGFQSLIEGFRNPTQVNATLFEIQVAAWCAARKLTQSIQLSPPVQIGGGIKRPEFLWHTDLGDLYCECKQENSFDNKATKRVQKLTEVVGRSFEANGPWNESSRLDVIIGHPARDGVDQIIERSIREAAARQQAGTWEGEILLTGWSL